ALEIAHRTVGLAGGIERAGKIEVRAGVALNRRAVFPQISRPELLHRLDRLALGQRDLPIDDGELPLVRRGGGAAGVLRAVAGEELTGPLRLPRAGQHRRGPEVWPVFQIRRGPLAPGHERFDPLRTLGSAAEEEDGA